MNIVKEDPSKADISESVSEKAEERPSSPLDCAICLEQLTDKSFTNSCLHMFCFRCLLAWSKVKPECPLCKQDFHSIIHNIRSMTDYEEYHVPPPAPRLSLYVNPDLQFLSNFRRFFHYRTTITSNSYGVPRAPPSNLVIQPYVDNLDLQPEYSRYDASHSSYLRHNRREIYLKDLETLPPPSEGRYRECSPEFFRENETQVHRLGRWLLRELTALSQIGLRFNLNEVLRVILDLLPVYDINSTVFFTSVNRYLGMHTSRFIREFRLFATSPFEMDQYDRDCVYIRQRSGSQLSFIVTVGNRDDTEDVQVIPRSNHQPFRPWTDVIDLSVPRPSTSASIARHHSAPSHSRYPSSSTCPLIPAVSPQPSTSQPVIDIISDSETDDCVIIEEVRNGPETIVLDDSDDDELPTEFSRRTNSPPDFYSTTHLNSENYDSGNQLSTSTVKSTAIVDTDRSSSQSVIRSPKRSASVISTDVSDDEGHKSSKKNKKKLNKKHRIEKKVEKNKTPRKYSDCESIDKDLSYMLMSSTSGSSDDGDSDWCCDRRARRKSKKSRTEKNTSKRKHDICPVETTSMKKKYKSSRSKRRLENTKVVVPIPTVKKINEPVSKIDNFPAPVTSRRLRSVVRKVENRLSNANHKEVNLNLPSTSRGLSSSGHRMYSTAVPRTIYSSDSD